MNKHSNVNNFQNENWIIYQEITKYQNFEGIILNVEQQTKFYKINKPTISSSENLTDNNNNTIKYVYIQ